MRQMDIAKFCAKAAEVLHTLEDGESVVLLSAGKPIAELSPVHASEDKAPSWKRRYAPVKVKGGGLSGLILAEREPGE